MHVQVRLFLSASSPDVCHERTFLLDFVLPALRVQACTRRVSLSWSAPPIWSEVPAEEPQQLQHACDLALWRLRALEKCRISCSAPHLQEDGTIKLRGPRQPFALVVVGQRVGEPLAPGANPHARRAVLAWNIGEGE